MKTETHVMLPVILDGKRLGALFVQKEPLEAAKAVMPNASMAFFIGRAEDMEMLTLNLQVYSSGGIVILALDAGNYSIETLRQIAGWVE